MADFPDQLLLPILTQLNVTPPPQWRQFLITWYDDLVDANRRTNLTRIVDRDDFLIKHIVDSWLVLAVYPDLLTQPLTVADVGCGAGFPGLPLALLSPQAHIVEIEANGKKHDYVAGLIQRLGLQQRATAVRGRARELSHLPAHQARYDLVLARAVADTATLIRETRQLLAPGGTLLACKTPASVVEEEQPARREADKTGLILHLSPIFELPLQAGKRQFILLRQPNG